MQPFFSIIVPTYNRAERLINTIESLLAQIFIDFEIIVVDDGSTDNTKAVVATLASRLPNLRYFYKVNEERSIARNYGIRNASGKYISFLDSDDRVYSNHLKVAHALLARNSFPEIGHLGYELMDDSGKSLLQRNDFDDSFRERLIHENILHGNAIFIRADIAQRFHFIESRDAILGEDWYLWLRLSVRFKFCFDNTVTSAVIQHDQRSLMNIDPERLMASTNVIIRNLRVDREFLRIYKRRCFYFFANQLAFVGVILALTKKRRGQTVQYLSRAFWQDPTVIFRKPFLAALKHFW